MAGPGLGLISSQPVGWLLFFTWPGTTPDTEEPGDGDPTGPSYAFLLGEALQDFHRKVCLNAPKARCPALRKFPSPSCPKCQRFMKLSVTALLTILKICKLPKCTLLGDCSDQTNQEIPRYRTTYGLLSNDAFISLFHCYACIMNLYDLRKCLWCALKEKQDSNLRVLYGIKCSAVHDLEACPVPRAVSVLTHLILFLSCTYCGGTKRVSHSAEVTQVGGRVARRWNPEICTHRSWLQSVFFLVNILGRKKKAGRRNMRLFLDLLLS